MTSWKKKSFPLQGTAVLSCHGGKTEHHNRHLQNILRQAVRMSMKLSFHEKLSEISWDLFCVELAEKMTTWHIACNFRVILLRRLNEVE
jgi:hypothetical protein